MATNAVPFSQVKRNFTKSIKSFVTDSAEISKELKELFNQIPEAGRIPDNINEKLKAFEIALSAIQISKGKSHDDNIDSADMNKAFDKIDKSHANWRQQPNPDINLEKQKTK